MEFGKTLSGDSLIFIHYELYIFQRCKLVIKCLLNYSLQLLIDIPIDIIRYIVTYYFDCRVAIGLKLI